jgi:hypothetical protein
VSRPVAVTVAPVRLSTVIASGRAVKNNGIRPELQRIWAIFDVRRDEWLDVYVDPDKCVSADT